MKNNKKEMLLLQCLLILGFSLLPFFLRKPPIKDWLLVFLWNAVTNGIIDKLIVSYKTVKYPVRLLPDMFKTNILFDFLLYPIITIAYNQLTIKDKTLGIFIKVFYFTIPMILIELWAERKTGLIKFQRAWKWYHSFISLSIKSLLTRLWIGWVRKVDEKQKTLNTL